MTDISVSEWPTHVRVAVIGTGFGGLCAGVRLAAAGISDFVLLERADSVGGTWRDNTYPGCACDVPSHLYSFSFARNPDWSHSFSRQPEIRAYLEGVTDQYRLREHIRFGAEVTEARWDGEANCWQLDTPRGPLRADVVISACGPLADPALPDIPGLGQFAGPVFHSARWDHGYAMAGKRIAVIGTGASAIQIVPEVQRQAERLVLFQRTPPWVMPRLDRKFTRAEKWLHHHVPASQRLARFGTYAVRETYVPAFTKKPEILQGAQRVALRHMARAISDPNLRAKLTPNYVLGCKRVLLSNDYYPALAQPNVHVVASGLARVEGNTLIAQDGSAHEVDAIVLATGFHTVDMPIAERVFGADGLSLAETWGGDMQALRGTTVAGFPNLCLVVGPNTGLGHTSMIHIIESQVAYIVDYLRTLDQAAAGALDARPEAQQRWCADIERRMEPTVWATGGCKSWYLNDAGRNPTLWPGTTIRFRRNTRRVDAREYRRIQAGPGKRGAPIELRPATPINTMRIPTTDGVVLHGEIHGRLDGPTVVLVHGWTNSTAVWGPVIRALGDEVRIVAYDQRGHGGSVDARWDRYSITSLVDDLEAVLAATVPEGEKAILVGHSMGGMTIMAAGQRPGVVERTAGALLVSTGYGDLVATARIIPGRSRRLATVLQRQILRSAAPMGPATRVSRAALRYGTMGPDASHDVAVATAQLVHACGRRTRGTWGRVLDKLEVGDALAGLDVPVHVLVGTNDRLTPPAHAERMAQRLPQCTGVTELPGVGHMTPLEAPETVADLTLKVVAESRTVTPGAVTSGAVTSGAVTSGAVTSGAVTSGAVTSGAVTSEAVTSEAVL